MVAQGLSKERPRGATPTLHQLGGVQFAFDIVNYGIDGE